MSAVWGLAAAATAVAWAGALAAALVREAGGRVMRPLVYLALLFFGLSAVFDILPESKAALSWPTFAAAAAAGYIVFSLVGKYVAPVCPACAMRRVESDRHHAHGSGLALLAIVLGVHCFLDGLGISAAATVGASFGWRVFAAIAVHKLPEGFALGLMLMLGSHSASRAFVWTAAIETATLAGAQAGAVWMHPSAFWLSLVLAHIGGTFLYLSVSGLRDALSPATPPVAAQP
jgi:zinc transporter ZupT